MTKLDIHGNKNHFRSSILPEGMDTQDIGSPENRWRGIYARDITASSLSLVTLTIADLNITGKITATSNVGPHKFGTGDATATAETPFLINMVGTGSLNSNYWGLIVAPNFVKHSSGTHAVVVGAELDYPHVTGAGATIDTISAVRVGADNLAPYASATNVYGLEMVNGSLFAHGGDAASVTRAAIRIGNNQIISWQDSGGAFTNCGFIYLDSSNNLKLGSGNNTRFTLSSAGDIVLTGSLTAGVNLAFAAANPRVLVGSGTLLFYDSTNTTEYFRITGTGGISINTAGSATTALLTPASVAGASSLRLPHGSAPSSPVNGDLWSTTTGLFARINGVTTGPYNAGPWTTPSFNAGDFTASGSMTWTVGSGDVQTYAYTVEGKTMTVAFNIITSTIGGTVDVSLKIKIPGGFTAAKNQEFCFLASDAGGTNMSRATISAGGTTIDCHKSPSFANWTLTTDNAYCLGTITFEVQ